MIRKFPPRGCQCNVRRNSRLDPLPDHAIGQTKVLAGGRDRMESLAANNDRDHVAPVLGALNVRCNPTAITRFVMAVGVFAVDLVRRGWARAHVRQERRKRLVPPLADSYATAAPMLEVMAGRTRAPFLHAEPRFVFGGHAGASFVAVNDVRFCTLRDERTVRAHVTRPFDSDTTARFRLPESQIFADDRSDFVAAVAPTPPRCSIAG